MSIHKIVNAFFLYLHETVEQILCCNGLFYFFISSYKLGQYSLKGNTFFLKSVLQKYIVEKLFLKM